MVGRSTKTQQSSNSNKRARDPEATKRQILNAAEEEFAKRGLSGSRIEAIANRAGVTTAMIHYYFQNKEGLYKTVLQRPASEFYEIFQHINLDELPAEEALKRLVREVIAYEASYPQRGMLWFQEALQNQGKYFKLVNWQQNFVHMIKILERGIAEGSFRQLDPFLTSIQIAGVCILYFNAYENLKHIRPDLQLLSPDMIEQYTQEAIHLVLAGIQKTQA